MILWTQRFSYMYRFLNLQFYHCNSCCENDCSPMFLSLLAMLSWVRSRYLGNLWSLVEIFVCTVLACCQWSLLFPELYLHWTYFIVIEDKDVNFLPLVSNFLYWLTMFISLHLLSILVVFKSSAWSSTHVWINKLKLQLYVPVGAFVIYL